MHKMRSTFFISMRLLMLLLAMSLAATVAQAAETDHSKMDHGAMSHAAMDHETMAQDAPPVATATALEKLSVMPASGKAREGGADGRYVMESTSVFDTMAEQCAKASRGLVMLDNAAWAQCGGKPQGAAPSSASLDTGHEHAGHAMP